VLATAASFVMRSRAPLSRYVVDGPSMEPAYRKGDRLLVNRLAYLRAAPRTGDVVVLRDPELRTRLLIKRVAQPPEGAPLRGRVYVLGDNAEQSRDSRHFGPVPHSMIIGRAWRTY
jgi:nickel-type superoxide dismutase maturation protease